MGERMIHHLFIGNENGNFHEVFTSMKDLRTRLKDFHYGDIIAIIRGGREIFPPKTAYLFEEEYEVKE